MASNMSAQHTPGPWRVEGSRGTFLRHVNMGTTSESWCFAPSLSTTGPRDEKALAKRARANAALIAAAPTMLDALERIASMTDVEADFDGFEARRIAQDALAKARGDS